MFKLPTKKKLEMKVTEKPAPTDLVRVSIASPISLSIYRGMFLCTTKPPATVLL